MACAVNTIKPCTYFEVADEGGAKGTGTILDSIVSVVVTTTSTTDYATSAKHDGAKSCKYTHSKGIRVVATGDEQDINFLALALDGSVSGTKLQLGAAGGSTVKTLYFNGFDVDGVAKEGTFLRVSQEPGTSITTSRSDQQLYEIALEAMVDTTATAAENFGYIDNESTDTTPPTVASTSPADGDTGVSVNVTPVITFSEAVREVDVSTKTVTLTKVTDNSTVTCTVARTDTAGLEYTVTPGSALTALSKYFLTVQKGIRDVAGNESVATTTYDFTTA